MGKFDCPICLKTAKKCESNKHGSIQCNVCDHWFHPPCAKVEQTTLKLIAEWVEATGSCPWQCNICKSALSKVASDVKKNTVKIVQLEDRAESLEGKVDLLQTSNDLLKKRLDDLEGKVETEDKKNHENSGEKVLQEVTERASRERNAVIHRCPELKGSEVTPDQLRERDLSGIQDLFNQIGLKDMIAKDVLIGWSRLGRKGGELDRPLILIFRVKADRDILLDRAPRLSRHEREFYRNVQIVPDLTPQQRQMEQRMFRQAEKNNLERTEEQISKNLVHKVLGKRGERVSRLVELRDNEELNAEGRVMRRQSGMARLTGGNMIPINVAGKRNHSPGNSPGSHKKPPKAARFGEGSSQ